MVDLSLLDDMGSKNRRDSFLEDVRREFIEIDSNRALIQFASGQNCMTSDVFILYAIGYFGCCSLESITMFLHSLKRKNPDMEIIYDKDKVKYRINQLFLGGYIFKTRLCEKTAEWEDSKERGNGYILYSVSTTAMKIVGQRLQKMIPENQEIYRMPIDFMLAWATSAYVASSLAMYSAKFSRYLDRTLKTKQISTTWFMPGELKFVDEKAGRRYSVCVTDGFLINDRRIMTTEDYNETLSRKINCIKNYLCTKARGDDEEAYVVVVVKDRAGLKNFCTLLQKVGYLDDSLDHIFFTGEGLVKGAIRELAKDEKNSIGDAFWRLKKDGYKLIQINPEFV